MYLRLLLPAFFLLLASVSVCAAPAAPGTTAALQPDGSSITVAIRGDEFQNWTESAETGHTIMRSSAGGYWEYAEQAPDGSLRNSGIRVLPGGINAPSHIPKGLRPPRNNAHEARVQQLIQDAYAERTAAASAAAAPTAQAAPPAQGDWLPAPVSGSRKVLVILVGFADRPINTTAISWSGAVFDGAAKSVARFYRENSFDSLAFSPAFHTQPGSPSGVVSVSLATNHPNPGGAMNFSQDQSWGNSALQLASSHVNFDSFDTNGDGKLDTSELVIYFIAAGYEASATSLTPSMWAHAWYTTGQGLTAGTKNVQRWALNGEFYNATSQMTIGVITHEMGHQICGLPDLYDISDNNNALGMFSVMASGSWGADSGELQGGTPTTLDAWSREYLGWATPVIASGSGEISLDYPLVSPSSVYKLVIPSKSSTEYFLVENRQPTSWDLGLRLIMPVSWKGGLLITHIDTTAGTKGSNDINSYTVNSTVPGHQGVVPVQAKTSSCDMLRLQATCYGHETTLFYSTNNAAWTPSTSPSSNYYNGAATNFSLTGISAGKATMTAALSLGPPVVTFTQTPPSVSNVPQATFAFESSDASASLECAGDADPYAPCSSPQSTAILSDGAHSFNVRATNSYGSTVNSYNWSIDTIPPDTSLTSWPADPTTARTAVFTFSSPESSATFQCRLDSGSYAPCSSGVSYGNLGAGFHTFSVYAMDGAGNTDSTPATYTWEVKVCNARIGTTCFPTIGEAYAAAQDGEIILALAGSFTEYINASRNVGVSLHGGYDAGFSNIVGFTTVLGMTLSAGSLDLAAMVM